MKTFLLSFLLSLAAGSLFAQTPSGYDRQWKAVDEDLKNALPASAEKKILAILEQARAEKNAPQVLKALCYFRKSRLSRDENARQEDILLLEKELKQAGFPTKQLIHSMLGSLYWAYYREHRWEILNRSELGIRPEPDSLDTWSPNDFFDQAAHHHRDALRPHAELLRTPVSALGPMLQEGEHTESLRPTLYDFLLHRALDFFTASENDLTRPGSLFELNDPMAFAAAPDFARYNFNSIDSTSPKYSALLLLQEALKAHSNDQDPSALIDVDLQRIRFANEYGTHPERKRLYREALQRVSTLYPNHAGASMARYFLAESYARDAQDPKKANPKPGYPEARAICIELLERFPESEAAAKAMVLKRDIEMIALRVQTEKAVLPNQPFLALVSYRNTEKIFVRVVSLSAEERREKSYERNNDAHPLIDRKPLRAWSVQLSPNDDYRDHTTEIKVDALPAGSYAIMVSTDEQFSQQHHYALSFVQVSTMAYVLETEESKAGQILHAMHRDTGEPLSGISIQCWTYQYDYNSRRYRTQKGPTFRTDANGLALMRNNLQQNPGLLLELINDKQERLWLDDMVYLQEPANGTSEMRRTYLFTDRAIYRPGQNILFKGIMMRSVSNTKNDSVQHELLKESPVRIQLLDVNGQVVTDTQLRTNAFGSFTGRFRAPTGLLTGQFTLRTEHGQAGVQVEEYKRPQFEVTLDSLKQQYKLRDRVTVSGQAKAYAGQGLGGTTVQYRVLREARFPYRWCFYYFPAPASPSLEVSRGSTRTNDDGSFSFSFPALPDAEIDSSMQPVFDFRVEADVTDVNGETHQGAVNIPLGYQPLILSLDLPERGPLNLFSKLQLKATTLSGTLLRETASLRMVKLQSPAKPLRGRLWEKADRPVIAEASFRRDFPNDAFTDEHEPRNWKEGAMLWSGTVNCAPGASSQIPDLRPEAGYYLVEARIGSVTEKAWVRLVDEQKSAALSGEALMLYANTEPLEPGANTNVQVTSAFQGAKVLLNIDRRSTSATQWKSMGTGLSIPITISESDRGGIPVQAMLVRNNRFHLQQLQIPVPFSNKQLDIRVETFRDRMLPGSQQEWILKVGPPKGLRDTGTWYQKRAELLATLYDASLDAFLPHRWNMPDLYPLRSFSKYFNIGTNFSVDLGRSYYFGKYPELKAYRKQYPQLNWWGLLREERMTLLDSRSRGKRMAMGSPEVMMEMADGDAPVMAAAPDGMKKEAEAGSNILADSARKTSAPPTPRSNFSETAFFYPSLQTDEQGRIMLRFKAPEALTRWRLMAFGHTQDLRLGQLEAESVTRKDLMIQPNMPRFMRQGDRTVLSARISNTGAKDLEVKALIELRDALNGQSVEAAFGLKAREQNLRIPAGQSRAVNWTLQIPPDFTSPLQVSVFAMSGNTSDGEQHVLPVVSNAVLVTESLPLPVKPNTEKRFRFKNLLNSDTSSTLRHHNLSVEYTGNPAWYAVQALPYLAEFPYECAEQTFNRFYANALATHIAGSSERIRTVYQQWTGQDSSALLSNLEKNTELKSALLEETPWVMAARNEKDQKRQMGRLFNAERMRNELDGILATLSRMQSPNGGFMWFRGMPDDRFITQYILTGIGRLRNLGVTSGMKDTRVDEMIRKAMPYLDARVLDDYKELQKRKTDLNKKQIDYTQIQYLYMRSFFPEWPVADASQTAFDYYRQQAKQYWTEENLFMQGMIALGMQRGKDEGTAQAIVRSMLERGIRSEEMGLYWKDLQNSYLWYEAPVETQALLAELMNETGAHAEEVEQIRLWLLKHKQTNHWKTTKATADACYALLLGGPSWLEEMPETEITLGKVKIRSTDQQMEAGTGYFKTSLEPADINAEQGDIRVSVKSNSGRGTTWGAVYWQYFEQMDKVLASATPLSLKRTLYRVEKGPKGETLMPVNEQTPLHPGDLVKVRIELRVDRGLEYVHLKDLRAACFEPVNVLSGCEYRDGLGFYESTRDLASHFFFQYLPKGTWVFEYPLRVNQSGDYNTGMANIQCMYAPEFSSHSEGGKIRVD
jgi:uncharacterized protein YfaS (alpha-2-macroglobulin family)